MSISPLSGELGCMPPSVGRCSCHLCPGFQTLPVSRGRPLFPLRSDRKVKKDQKTSRKIHSIQNEITSHFCYQMKRLTAFSPERQNQSAKYPRSVLVELNPQAVSFFLSLLTWLVAVFFQFVQRGHGAFDKLVSRHACIEYASHNHAFVSYDFAVSPAVFVFVVFSFFLPFVFFVFAFFSSWFVFFSLFFAAIFCACSVDCELWFFYTFSRTERRIFHVGSSVCAVLVYRLSSTSYGI